MSTGQLSDASQLSANQAGGRNDAPQEEQSVAIKGATCEAGGTHDAPQEVLAIEGTIWSVIGKGMGALAVLAVVTILGGAVFCAAEEWAFMEACFFAMTIFTTVGYGSFVPVTAGGKVLVSTVMTGTARRPSLTSYCRDSAATANTVSVITSTQSA